MTKFFNDFKYVIMNDDIIIYKFKDESAIEVEIPKTIEDYPVTAIGTECFSDNKK